MTQTQLHPILADSADRSGFRNCSELATPYGRDDHDVPLRARPDYLTADDWRFLAECGVALEQAEELRDALGIGLRLLVPRVADFAVFWLAQADTSSAMRRVAYARPELAATVGHQGVTGPIVLQDEHPASRVQRTGIVEWGSVDPARLGTVAHDAEHLAQLRALAPRSVIHVPLRVRGRILGSVVLGRACGDAPLYREVDVALATELALRFAMAFARTQERDALRSAFQTRAASVAATSHDLKDPLALIETAVTFAIDGVEELRQTRDDPSVDLISRQLVIARRAAQRARTFVAHTLDGAAAAHANPRIPCVQTDHSRPSAVLHELVDEMSVLARTRDITLAIEVPDDLPSICMAAADLGRVIGNVLGNALKFTPSRGRVTVRASAVHGTVQISISDSGRGIRAIDLPHVFRPFWRATKKRSAEGSDEPTVAGSGLGLAIARELVQRAGGSIWCRSTYGAGATFRIQLPLAASLVA